MAWIQAGVSCEPREHLFKPVLRSPLPWPQRVIPRCPGSQFGDGRRHRSNSEPGVSERQSLQEAGFQGVALPELGGGVLTRPWRGNVGREVLLEEEGR